MKEIKTSMKPKTRYRLLWIKGMMLVSQLLLIVLICSWLYAQYNDEKTTLQKDLNTELAAAKQSIADSLIFAKFIKPVVNDTHRSKNVKITYSTSNMQPRGKEKFVMVVDDSSSINIDSLTGGIDIRALRKKLTNDANNGKAVVRNKVVYTADKNEEAMEKLTIPLVSAVMSKLSENGLLEGEAEKIFSFQMDTFKLRKLFADRLHHRDWDFKTTWLKNKKAFSQSSGDILIESEYYNRRYYASVGEYDTYLVKQITPQVLFTLLLLTITTMAFLVTYRTLKEQMRLSTIKNEFISNMSHELKTPISTVKVALEALTNFNMIENPVVTREYLEMAAHEMNRLDMLVNQALNAALLEEGKLVVRREKEDLQQILSDTIRVLQIRIQQYHASVKVNTQGNYFTSMADRLHVQGVLVNLIDNGLKYSGAHPGILIDIMEKEHLIEISVADNGPGIPEEYLDKIYDKFFRVPTDNKHNVKGYGLGLSYAYQIMQQHNGQITAQNRKEGGCTFTLIFPKA